MSNKLEIERKFLLTKENFQLLLHKYYVIQSYPIEQYYTEITDSTEERVRLEHVHNCFITRKSGNGLVRTEKEYSVSEDYYTDKIYKKIGNEIRKQRTVIYTDWLELESDKYKITTELDVYRDNLDGLIVAEIEFKSIEDANSYIPHPLFGKEVTDDTRYKNKNLALHGAPNENRN